jgi:hypothetical protein
MSCAVSWHVVTLPDEQQRCCVVIDGERCSQITAFRIASADGAADDYTFTCSDHVNLALTPGYLAAWLIDQRPQH